MSGDWQNGSGHGGSGHSGSGHSGSGWGAEGGAGDRGDLPGGSYGAREPLHQPPNAADLGRVPPSGPICARVRGWLRDYVDGDLSAASRRHVDEHCHVCRVCAVALARAEHEVLRLRRAFEGIGRDERDAGETLRDGFADRVVDRLVRDETVGLPREVGLPQDVGLPRDVGLSSDLVEGRLVESGLVERASEPRPDLVARVVAAAAREVGERDGSGFGSGAGRSGRNRGVLTTPSGLLVACTLLFAAVVSLAVWLDRAEAVPDRLPRLVVTQAEFTYDEDQGRLGSGDGIGEHETILVGADGNASIAYNDDSPLNQPAATLKMNGSGKVMMVDGAPLLLGGNVRVDTNRPVSVAVGDGSRLDFGIGEYVVTAEAQIGPDWGDSEQYLPQVRDPLSNAPQDLRVRVEVVSGDPAHVVRSQGATVVVSAGSVGVYQGGSFFEVQPAGGSGGGEQGVDVRVPGNEPTPTLAVMSGDVFEGSGQPSAGTEVLMAFASNGYTQYGRDFTGADGRFLFEMQAPPDSTFAIVHAVPPALRLDLAVTAPDAYRLLRSGLDARIENQMILPTSAPLIGVVKDEAGNERLGVRVVPCWIDELFGNVFPWVGGQTITDANGRFTVRRLPAQLPHHQYLALMLLHPDLDPTIVPVPVRGSLAANVDLPPIAMKMVRGVRMHGLTANTTYILYEEVEGLPAGSAAWQRSVTTDAQGIVASTMVGSGRLWLQSNNPTHIYLREMIQDDEVGQPRFHPNTASQPISLEELFRPWQPVPGSSMLLCNSYRHEHFVTTNQSQVQGPMMRAVHNQLGLLSGAQVFAVSNSGPRGQVNARFLGFTSTTGVISLAAVVDGESLFVIGPDGSTGSLSNPLVSGSTVEVALQATGRVLLGPGLIPTSPAAAVRLDFEYAGSTLGGMQPIAHRFACANGGWEVSGLPAGDYRVTLDGVQRDVTVPSTGFVELH